MAVFLPSKDAASSVQRSAVSAASFAICWRMPARSWSFRWVSFVIFPPAASAAIARPVTSASFSSRFVNSAMPGPLPSSGVDSVPLIPPGAQRQTGLSGADARPRVEMLGPTGGPVLQSQLQRSGVGEELEVPARCAAADTRPSRYLSRRDVAVRAPDHVDDERERRRGDPLRQRSLAPRAQQGVEAVDLALVGLVNPLEARFQRRVGLEPLPKRVEGERLYEVM